MNDKQFLKLAIEQAKISVQKGGFPAGAVIVKDGKVVSEGISIGYILNDPTSHAETSSIKQACQNLKESTLQKATLYASLQPCLMCFSVANWAGITKIVYGCKKSEKMINKNYYEGKTDINEINKQNNRQIELVYISDFENEMLNLVKNWEDKLK